MSCPFFVALPGGASHVSTIAGAAIELNETNKVLGWSGVSAGFLVALLAAFDELDTAPRLIGQLLQGNKVLDWKQPDGNLGLCAWEVIPRLVDQVLGDGVKMGDAIFPLVGVATSADTGKPVYFSRRDTPNVLCRDVARATSALVPLASMVPIPSLGSTLSPDVRLFFDGGFTDNLPDHVFDEQVAPTVALSLEGAHAEITRVRSFAVDTDAIRQQALAVMRSVTFAAAQRKSRRRFTDGVFLRLAAKGSGLDFDLTPAETAVRVARGQSSVSEQAHLLPQ